MLDDVLIGFMGGLKDAGKEGSSGSGEDIISKGIVATLKPKVANSDIILKTCQNHHFWQVKKVKKS